MTATTTKFTSLNGRESSADAEALQECLSRAVAARFGAGATIVDVQRRWSEYSSSYETEIIDVSLTDGRRAQFFKKDYGNFRNPKEGMALRREREMRVFRDVLPRTGLGTPLYCGSTWDEGNNRLWLVLEFVQGTQLRHLDFPHWVAAISWLGRMQTHFATRQDDLSRQNLLIRQDEGFFRSTARLAVDVVTKVSVPMGARLNDVLRGRYDPVVKTMTDQPVTLVHGAYRPPNILVIVDERGATERVCPIDWEEASLGSPLYDVAYLSDGFELQRLHQMWDAYLSEAEAGAVPLLDRCEMARVVDCFRAHKLLNLLGKSRHRGYPHAKIEKMIGMTDDLLGALQ